MKGILFFVLLIAATCVSALKFIKPTSAGIVFKGRHRVDGSSLVFDWSSISISAQFTGNLFGVKFKPNPVPSSIGWNEYAIFINKTLESVLKTNNVSSTYIAFNGTNTGATLIELYKRTEALFGAVTLEAIILEDSGEILPLVPEKPCNFKMEVIGDRYSV